MSWEKVKLKELYEVHNGLSKASKFFGTGFPFLSFSTVFNNYFIPDEITDLVQSTEKEQKNYSIKCGDVFVTRTSETANELGMSCVALKDYPQATYNGFTKRMRPVTDKLLPKYVGYYMRLPSFRAGFQAFSTMTTRASLRNEDLLGLQIAVPPIAVQKKIAGILTAYDDLIENNKKQIKLLEEMAQRLYKEWFVDLHFPGYEDVKIVDGVPEGWKCIKLEAVIDVCYGKDHKNISDGDINVYGSGGIIRRCSKFLFKGESVLIPRKGSLNNILYVDEAFWTVDTMFFTKMKMKNVGVFVYLFLKSLDMYSLNTGSAVPSMTVKIINNLEIVFPCEDVLNLFNKTNGYCFKQIKILNKQIELAQEEQKRLITKLMTGELEDV